MTENTRDFYHGRNMHFQMQKNMRFLILLLCSFFWAYSVSCSPQNIHQPSSPQPTPGEPNPIVDPSPGDNNEVPPIQAPSPPIVILQLQASGHFKEVQGLFEISGSVTDQGAPVAGARVDATGLRTSEVVQAQTDEAGQFSLVIHANAGDVVSLIATEPQTGAQSNTVELAVVGSNQGQLFAPDQIASWNYGGEEYLFVSEKSINRIQIFKRQGKGFEFVLQYGVDGSYSGQFLGISDLKVDAQGYLYVAEQDNSRVQVFKFDGKSLEYVTESRRDIVPDPYLLENSENWVENAPQHLSVDQRGHIFTCGGKYFHSFKFSKSHLIFKARNNILGGQTTLNCSGLASGPSGNFYFLDSGDSLLKQYRRNGEKIGFVREYEIRGLTRFVGGKAATFIALVRDGARSRLVFYVESLQGLRISKEVNLDFLKPGAEILDMEVSQNSLYFNVVANNRQSFFILDASWINDPARRNPIEIPLSYFSSQFIKNIVDGVLTETGRFILAKKTEPVLEIFSWGNASKQIIDLKPILGNDAEPLTSLAWQSPFLFAADAEGSVHIFKEVEGQLSLVRSWRDDALQVATTQDHWLYVANAKSLKVYSFDGNDWNLAFLPYEIDDRWMEIADIAVTPDHVVFLDYHGGGYLSGTVRPTYPYDRGMAVGLVPQKKERILALRYENGAWTEVSAFKDWVRTSRPSQLFFKGQELYEADSVSHRVKHYHWDGTNLEWKDSLGSYGYGYASFHANVADPREDDYRLAPFALTASENRLYVLDASRIQAFALDELGQIGLVSGATERNKIERAVYRNPTSDNQDPHFCNKNSYFLDDADGDGLLEPCDFVDNRFEDAPDSDDDGLSDEYEISIGSQVNDADTDGDGIPDGDEIGPDAFHPSDIDLDHIPDILEPVKVLFPTNTAMPFDVDEDGRVYILHSWEDASEIIVLNADGAELHRYQLDGGEFLQIRVSPEGDKFYLLRFIPPDAPRPQGLGCIACNVTDVFKVEDESLDAGWQNTDNFFINIHGYFYKIVKSLDPGDYSTTTLISRSNINEENPRSSIYRIPNHHDDTFVFDVTDNNDLCWVDCRPPRNGNPPFCQVLVNHLLNDTVTGYYDFWYPGEDDLSHISPNLFACDHQGNVYRAVSETGEIILTHRQVYNFDHPEHIHWGHLGEGRLDAIQAPSQIRFRYGKLYLWDAQGLRVFE